MLQGEPGPGFAGGLREPPRSIGVSLVLGQAHSGSVMKSDTHFTLLPVGRFLITDSVSLFLIGLFKFSVSLWVRRGRLFLGIDSFCLRYPIC